MDVETIQKEYDDTLDWLKTNKFMNTNQSLIKIQYLESLIYKIHELNLMILNKEIDIKNKHYK